MKIFNIIVRIAIVLAFAACYFVTLWFGLTEEERRELTITSSSSGDVVVVNIRVTSVDTARGLLTERIRLVPMGRFAMDQSTPAMDLKLLLNSVSGKQTVNFPKGVRIDPVDATTLLTGNPTKYPFDRYSSAVDILVTTPSKQTEDFQNEGADTADFLSSGSLIVGTSDFKHSESVSVDANVIASIPGLKFTGQVTRDGKLTHSNIAARRANSVIFVSLIVMITMVGLAISVMAMVLRVTASPGEINLLPLSLCVTLIFGLPALRNIQPGVPGVGVLGDYFSFIWAEFMVSISAIALAWTWIVRSRKQDKLAKALDKKTHSN